MAVIGLKGMLDTNDAANTMYADRVHPLRQLKIVEHLSLDGVIQHSDDGDGFPYSDWSAPYRTPEGREALRVRPYRMELWRRE